MLAIIGNNAQKEELLASLAGNVLPENISWLQEPGNEQVPTCIDLLFENSNDRIELLQKNYSLVLVSNVLCGLIQLPPNFISINGWSGFLQKNIIEAFATSTVVKEQAEEMMLLLQKKMSWVENSPVFISTRIIVMIINEAYSTLEENIATKEAIDTAMKMGTNYPYGPFEWASKIGLKNVVALLTALAFTHKKYTPNALLIKEATAL
jgi:3-hydroxybutyryl-CoA dehydrogenase